MPSKNSYPVRITDLEELVEAVNREPELQPSVETERQALAQVLAEVQGLRARQLQLKALRQEVTQLFKAALEKGKDVAMQIRSILKGKIGPRNERLAHIKVKPLRKRRKKPAKEEPNRETPSTPSGAAGSPSDKAAA